MAFFIHEHRHVLRRVPRVSAALLWWVCTGAITLEDLSREIARATMIDAS
jgi:hypothetical protein